MAKQKTINDYPELWKRIKADPDKYIREHISLREFGEPLFGNPLIIGTTAQHHNKIKVFDQTFRDLKIKLIRVVLFGAADTIGGAYYEGFVQKYNRIPRRGEKAIVRTYLYVTDSTNSLNVRLGDDSFSLQMASQYPKEK